MSKRQIKKKNCCPLYTSIHRSHKSIHQQRAFFFPLFLFFFSPPFQWRHQIKSKDTWTNQTRGKTGPHLSHKLTFRSSTCASTSKQKAAQTDLLVTLWVQLFGVNSDKESEGAEPCWAPALNDSQSLRSPNCQSPKSVQYPQCHF